MSTKKKSVEYNLKADDSPDSITLGVVIGDKVTLESDITLYNTLAEATEALGEGELLSRVNKQTDIIEANAIRIKMRSANKHLPSVTLTPEQKAKASTERKNISLLGKLCKESGKSIDEIKDMLGLA